VEQEPLTDPGATMDVTKPKINWGAGTVLGLLIAAAGVLVPIVWDRYKSRAELTLEHSASTTFLNTEQVPEGLRLTYGGAPIANLSRVSFALINTGHTPIRSSDVALYPTIEFPDSEILEVATPRVVPLGILVNLKVDASKKQLQAEFPLLNPGDRVEISLLVTGPSPRFSSNARVSGISELRRTEHINAAGGLRSIPFTVWAAAPFTGFALLAVLVGINMLGAEVKLEALWDNGTLVRPGGTPAAIARYIDGTLNVIKSETEQRPVRGFLAEQPQDKPLDDQALQRLYELITKVVRDRRATTAVLVVFAIVAVSGLVYTVPAFVLALSKP
jgi:hypothetical protein